MQTPRDISYTGNPTGGTTAYPAVLPAAHEATENSDNIFYRTIRTVMKKQLICLLASAGLLAAGCSTENAPETTGYGTLSVSCTADTSIDTAAGASGTPEAPAAGAFSLTVTGETGTQKWDTLTEFEQSETVFRMGSYTVAIAHGDPDAEGAGKPYYYAEQKIEVLPRRTVNADLTATVANSQVVIRATEQFLAYFHDARFTVTTASGNEFAFTPGTTVQFGLRSSGGEWQPMAGTSQGDDFITATYAPQWVPQTVKEQTVYTQAAGTGIIATHSYDFRAIINGTETTGTFTAGEVQPIPNGDMSGWSMTGGFAFPNAAGESFWSSGNNTMTKTLCTSTDVKFGKSAPAAKLTSTNMLVLAAGNLFTGEFAYKSFTGTVQFGQTYAFTARPSAMKVKYHAHVGTVDKVRTSGDICPYIKKGDPDMARIFVAIVDWNAPHEVVSGMTTTKGAWDPEKGIDNVSEGKILGYGSLWITQSTDGEDMQDAELDIVWYDHETRPAEGKYSLVISCACNAYGDYFTGCSKNVMYVDDFEWVY